MKPEVSRVGKAVGVGLALALSLASIGTLQARQDPPAAQKPAEVVDGLKLTQNVPHILIFAVKPARAADFESGWDMIRAEFAKTERPEVKEFAATFTKFQKVNMGPAPPPEAPVIYVIQLDTPSLTQSYLPGKIIYEFLYYIKDGKEGGIPRVEADKIFDKLKGDLYLNVSVWPLMKIGS